MHSTAQYLLWRHCCCRLGCFRLGSGSRGFLRVFGVGNICDLHRFECKSKYRNLARSFEDRMGRAVAHLSLSNSIVSSFMLRPRRMTPLIVVFSDSTTPKRTA